MIHDFPWGVTIGLGVVLLGTLFVIVYILRLDIIEENEKENSPNTHSH